MPSLNRRARAVAWASYYLVAVLLSIAFGVYVRTQMRGM